MGSMDHPDAVMPDCDVTQHDGVSQVGKWKHRLGWRPRGSLVETEVAKDSVDHLGLGNPGDNASLTAAVDASLNVDGKHAGEKFCP